MATQKETSALIFTQLSAIIEKYGISQINDEYHSDTPEAFSMARNLTDQRSRLRFKTNDEGDITSFELRLNDNLPIPAEFKSMVNYDLDFYERIGDPNDAFSFFSFTMKNINDDIKRHEDTLANLNKRLRLRLYRHERKSAEEAKIECENALHACLKVKVKKSVALHSKSTQPIAKKLSAKTANTLFKKLIALGHSNMRDATPAGKQDINALKRAIST